MAWGAGNRLDPAEALTTVSGGAFGLDCARSGSKPDARVW
jgi:hypothetical protein